MSTLPDDILMDIVRRVGCYGFQYLGPFIVAGPCGLSLVYSPSVLANEGLDKFIFAAHLAEEGSVFHPFFMKCLEANNITTKYVEGLRILVQVGPSDEALEVVKAAIPNLMYARMVYSTVLICCGKMETGLTGFRSFMRDAADFEKAIEICENVITAVTELGSPTARLYTGPYLEFSDFPLCQFKCSTDGCCEKCMPLDYAFRFSDLC